MDFLVNDLSFHGQFDCLNAFRKSIEQLMEFRGVILNYNRTLYSHRNLTNVQVTQSDTMCAAVQSMPINSRRAFMSWITKTGPFWEDVRQHDESDWFEFEGNPVADIALGEAAWCCMNGNTKNLVSIMPSDWNRSPLNVTHVQESESNNEIPVLNFWEKRSLEQFLNEVREPISSWKQLEDFSRSQFENVQFTDDAFVPLAGQPFMKSPSDRIFGMLGILNKLKECYDGNGNRTKEGHALYQDFFTGKKGNGGRGAMFTDSSEDEKNKYKRELTFRDPDDATGQIFCPWHGKIQTPAYRVHFTYPITANDPLYVVYVGRKLTI